MYYSVKDAWVISGTMLYVEFDDGKRGTYDMSSLIGEGVFVRLADAEEFRSARSDDFTAESGDHCTDLHQRLRRRPPPQGLPRPPVEQVLGLADLAVGHVRELGPLREELPEQAVGVLVGAPLPGRVRVAEAGPEARRLGEAGVLGHLSALVPGERGEHGGAPPSGTDATVSTRSPSQRPGTARSSASDGRARRVAPVAGGGRVAPDDPRGAGLGQPSPDEVDNPLPGLVVILPAAY